MGGGNGGSRQIFVGNLPFTTTWQDLKGELSRFSPCRTRTNTVALADAFKEDYDVVRAEILTGPDGKPKGAGTVLFGTPEDAARAIRDFHDATFDGRVITVRFDKFAGQ